jgi:hypothetical protein
MIEANGRVVIMDFGLVHDPSMTQLTKTGTIMGTPQYMSPELLSGEKTDPRSDIFQLGSITHECLCGKPAFPGSTVPEVGAKIMFGRYVPIRQVDPSVSADWETFLLNCLGTERTARYQSASAVLADLQKMMVGSSVALLVLEEPAGGEDSAVLEGATASKTSSLNMKDGDGVRGSGVRKSSVRRSRTSGEGKDITDTDPQLFKANASRIGARTVIERPLGLSSGRISSASFIDNPDNVKKSRAVIMATAFTIILVVFSSIFYTLVLKTEYDTFDLSVVPGVGNVRVSWKSFELYPSVVSVSQGANDSRIVNGESSENVKEHSIRIDGLKFNTQYSIQILYPDDAVGPIKRLRTLDPKIKIKSSKFSNDTLNITWAVTPPGKTKLWVKRSNKGASSVFDAIQSGGTEGVSIDDASELIDSISFDVEWEDGSTHKVSLKDVLSDEVGLLCNRLDAFDVNAFQKTIDETVDNRVGVSLNQTIGVKGLNETEEEFKSRKKREEKEANIILKKTREEARVKIGESFVKIETYQDYQRAVQLSPIILGLSIIEPSLKFRFYEHMQNYVNLYAFLSFNKTDVTEIKPLPHLGLFQSRLAAPARTMDKIDSINLIPSIPEGKCVVIGPTIPWGQSPGHFHSIVSSFKISDLKTYTRSFIFMSIKEWDDCVLIISVNGNKPEFMAYNDPAISETKKRDDDIKIGIPIDFLKEGDNNITFTQTTLFNSMGRQEVDTRGIFLHLYK